MIQLDADLFSLKFPKEKNNTPNMLIQSPDESYPLVSSKMSVEMFNGEKNPIDILGQLITELNALNRFILNYNEAQLAILRETKGIPLKLIIDYTVELSPDEEGNTAFTFVGKNGEKYPQIKVEGWEQLSMEAQVKVFQVAIMKFKEMNLDEYNNKLIQEYKESGGDIE